LLEASVGSALLKRSTRALSLTDAGRRFFERVQPIVREAEAAQSEIRTANREPSGMLRVTALVSFGETSIAPGLMQFLEQHPRIRADLHFSDDRVNIIAEGFDLAIRTGELVDSDLISRRLADMARVIVAALSDLADGTLARVLPRYDLPKTPVTALYPRSIVPSLALRAFLDALHGWCA
jgi:DNA-binding transcriptional LysR family regulator